MIQDSPFMQALLLMCDRHNIYLVAKRECRRRRCRRAQHCKLLERPGDALSCMAPSEWRSKLDRDRQIVLAIFRGIHPFIYKATPEQLRSEEEGIYFANLLLPPDGPDRARFEAWLLRYRALAARRDAGEFDRPVDVDSLLTEIKAEVVRCESALARYDIK